jgi:type II secretory ATPase GspE/PulE/Tfp pilus assembly ATPase PilB-like protein
MRIQVIESDIMAKAEPSLKSDQNAKLNEAEVCFSMGLFDEALSIFSRILQDYPDLDGEKKKSIQSKIDEINAQLEEQVADEAGSVSTEEISMLKKSLSGQEDAPAILDSASAFKDLGLFEEALSEYEKILFLDYPSEKIITDIVDCLLKLFSPNDLFDKILKIAGDQRLETEKRGLIKYHFGLEMEKRDYRDLALDLYEEAEKDTPEEPELLKRIETLRSRLSSGSKYDFLLRQQMVTTEQLQKAATLAKQSRKSVEAVLIENFGISREDIGKSFSQFYGCTFRSYEEDLPTPYELLGNLKKAFLLHELWVPLNWGKEGVEVLVDDPRDLNKTDNIKALMKTGKINFCVAIREDIEAYIKRFYSTDQYSDMAQNGEALENFDDILDVSFEEEEDDIDDRIDELDESSSKVVKLVDQCLIAAYRKNASDIHIEPSPQTKSTNIRFRMDGVCQDYIKVPNSLARGIISRIKIMSNLDIAERRLPQDGKIKFKRKGIPPFELRVATLPTAGGFEDAVLRILATAGAMKLEDMGLDQRNFDVLTKAIAKPYGLILCVGPTGSGKTTTLHAALGHINKPGIKIWTAEDPVEITQLGLRQVEAKPKIGLDFARIMRAFLRADPDVIMIGEMRDEETASIGVEASLTGHLVFSTLHTNSAPETVTRLLDMGLNPLNFSDAFLGVLAQRLVRRLCSCKKEYHPTQEEFDQIISDYGSEYWDKSGLGYTDELLLYHAGSCEKCSGTGYKGRMGIHELMDGTKTVKRLIKQAAPTDQLFAQAIEEGMSTLKQDGIKKAFKGYTDMIEVKRVCIV